MINNSILNNLFYDLLDNGYIYDRDENGLNMSYGEYVAISEYITSELVGYLQVHYSNLEEQIDELNNILENTEDDVKIFVGINCNSYGVEICEGTDENGDTNKYYYLDNYSLNVIKLLDDNFENKNKYELVA